ncbi:MAG: tRNA (N(6)-L-threonylcarbamoyladenosine(37)-C(2))-methylthiotransferase MtaB [Erysipelotrichaceae bacterium]|nr:tRNA (N(6)-L-threonylcarbamoyladenosine(37)-C(2))-methylthiotransferase MtaB [Erysipelotrichaceae bacterium]
MKFSICNLGCKVNNYEANWYSQQLAQKYEEVPFGAFSDIFIINTCTVTNTAGSKSRQMMHRARKINPEAVLCVVGCYVQMEYTDEKIFEDCDILIGSNHKLELPALIDEFLEKREKIARVEPFEETPFEEMKLLDYRQTRAYLKIQDGCNQFCTYCVIPLARGRERSLDADRVIDIARTLTEKGHSELVLTGIHTGRYYHDGTDFTALVRRLLAEVPELRRLRISSIEMTEVTDEFVELMKNDERIARHLHIPLQSGCDITLKAMGRPYTTEDYLNKIESIRREIPDISISSDVIVGFPGESEEDFAATVKFIERANLSFLHVFPYAAKQHTVAAGLKQQVREEIKRQRVTKLTELSDRLYNDYVSGLAGKQGKVLFERKMDGYWQGHNSEYVLVKVTSEEDLAGRILTVSYHRRDGECLIGSLREDQKHEHK